MFTVVIRGIQNLLGYRKRTCEYINVRVHVQYDVVYVHFYQTVTRPAYVRYCIQTIYHVVKQMVCPQYIVNTYKMYIHTVYMYVQNLRIEW